MNNRPWIFDFLDGFCIVLLNLIRWPVFIAFFAACFAGPIVLTALNSTMWWLLLYFVSFPLFGGVVSAIKNHTFMLDGFF
jgi:hypothetical protein